MSDLSERLTALYPECRVRGRSVLRSEARSLGFRRLDADAACELGCEHQAWLAGGHPGLQSFAQQLARLDTLDAGGWWVASAFSRDQCVELHELWKPLRKSRKHKSPDTAWCGQSVVCCPIEDLKVLSRQGTLQERGVAGVMLFDSYGSLHRFRAGKRWDGAYHRNDRPQHVVNFRCDHAIEHWQPPLIILAVVPVKSIDIPAMARAFMLDGFVYIAGDSFACWDSNIEA